MQCTTGMDSKMVSLKLNASKCMVMSFSRNVEKSCTYNILENSQIKPLARTDQITDLGILLDERLKIL